MEVADLPKPSPKQGEALVRLTAIGVNYRDVYVRTGMYPIKPPYTPGSEGAGVVEAIGPQTETDLAVGDRVVWAGSNEGSYAEYNVVETDRLVKIPDGLDGGEGRVIPRSRGRRGHQLRRAGFRSRGQTAHRRPRRRVRLRFGRENDVREKPQLVARPRLHGDVRDVERARRPDRPEHLRSEGLALLHAPDPVPLHTHQNRDDDARHRSLQSDSQRRAQGPDRT